MLHKKFKTPVLILSAAAAILALDACSRPNSFPTGYVYHDKKFKSPNPPASDRFTESQRKTMGPEQADQFRLAVYSLLESLTTRAGLPPKPVFVQRPDRMTALYANMDNDMRESLLHLGYRLSDTPQDAYMFTYNAELIKLDDKAAAGVPNVHIALQVHTGVGDSARMLTEEAGNFYISGAEEMHKGFPWFSGAAYKQ